MVSGAHAADATHDFPDIKSDTLVRHGAKRCRQRGVFHGCNTACFVYTTDMVQIHTENSSVTRSSCSMRVAERLHLAVVGIKRQIFNESKAMQMQLNEVGSDGE